MNVSSFRPCVAIALFNSTGRILIAERNDQDEPCWQLPQGGIDEGETPVEAAFREMEEEIGTRSAVLIEEAARWTQYDWPADIGRTPGKGRYGGQRVKPVAFCFSGRDRDVNLNTEHPEFRNWRWTELETIPGLIVEFKRPLYTAIAETFAHIPRKAAKKPLR